MAKKKPRNRSAQDATLINVRALYKLLNRLLIVVETLTVRVTKLERRK